MDVGAARLDHEIACHFLAEKQYWRFHTAAQKCQQAVDLSTATGI